MANYCLVDTQNEKVSIFLHVDNGGQSGGKFWLWKHDGNNYQPIEKHQASSDPATGLLEIELNSKPEDMEGTILTWLIQSCSRINGNEDLKIKIRFYQDQTKCKTTSSVNYRKDYPNCGTGNALQNSGEVTFTLINKPTTTRLWANMDS